MIFNPDLSKQAQEIIFSRKTNKVSHPTSTFNTVPVVGTPCQKYLGLYLSKANKGIGIIKKLSHILPRKSLITIFKSFIRPHLDYCNVICD